MESKVKIVIVDSKYCAYLKKYDSRVLDNTSKKENRPFIGILFKINDLEYFAPLSSPKSKHKKMTNTIDFHKIENNYYDDKDKKNKKQLLGVINFNNMIPLKNNNYTVVDFNKICKTIEEEKYIKLLRIEFEFIGDNFEKLKKKALKFS